MDVDFTPMDEGLTDRFEAQLRPLVRAVREAVEDQIFADPGSSSVGQILQDAPAGACLSLSDSWAVADLVGVSSADLLARFDPIDRFVIEMVTGIYSNSRCGIFDGSERIAHPV